MVRRRERRIQPGAALEHVPLGATVMRRQDSGTASYGGRHIQRAGMAAYKDAGSAQRRREGQDGWGWEEVRGELQPPDVLLFS